MKRKVLIVSYYFPPQNVIGAVRIGKLAKYLERLGWEPWVLTLDEGVFATAGELLLEIDQSHVARAGLGCFFTRVARRRRKMRAQEQATSKLGEASEKRSLKGRAWRWLSGCFSDIRFPDRALPWYLPALKVGNALLKNYDFDAVLSSHGPPASHIVASILARRHNLVWVADYRDLWSLNHLHARAGIVQFLEQRFELWIMRRCNHMTTVSEPLAIQLSELHGKPVTVIPNGFDHEDYLVRPPYSKHGSFSIIYTGMIYPGKQDPSIVFDAVRTLVDKKHILPGEIQFYFYGADKCLVESLAAKQKVSEWVTAFSRIPHADAIAAQIRADVLLLLEWTDVNAKGVFTGKVFEYLGAGRPILAVGPKGGVIEALLRETRTGVLLSTKEDAMSFLLDRLCDHRATGAIKDWGDGEAINRYTRYKQAQALAEILTHVIQQDSNAH